MIDLTDVVFRHIKKTRKWPVVFDIGANDGGYINTFDFHLQGRGEIHAFEPVPGLFKGLQNRIKEFKTKTILNCIGVSDETKTIEKMRLYNCWTLLPEGSVGNIGSGECVEEMQKTQGGQSFSVNFDTIDNYVIDNDIKMIDFIKVDTDGFEFKFLRGALYTLGRFKPPMLFELSYLTTLVGDSYEQMVRYIFDIGYLMFYWDGSGRFETADEFIPKFPHNSSHDIMLIHRKMLWQLGGTEFYKGE
jgi:FkbM family methyltransferase